MQMLKIIKCSDPIRWYANLIGQTVPYVGDSMCEYMSQDRVGCVNYVQYEDAELVDVSVEMLS